MFKAKAFKELIGFNHTGLIIGTILITSVLFPFMFLHNSLEAMWRRGAFVDVVIGMVYASLLLYGNLRISYHYKKDLSFEDKATQLKRTKKQLFLQLLYTLAISFLMCMLQKMQWGGRPMSIEFIARNMIGSVLITFLYLGLYEAAYFSRALGRSLQKQEQLQRENVESQLETLKNQVKPHFLFNSLNTLASLIPDDQKLAVDYVQKLSKVYRYILEIKEKKLIPLSEELACVEAYLFMLQIRFGQNLRFDIDETNLDARHHVVPLSLQLLIENAVKHNIVSTRKPLFIEIKKGKNGSLIVSNNLQPKLQQMPSTGTGLSNIRSRYELLTKEKVEVMATDQHFTVTLPLIEVQ